MRIPGLKRTVKTDWPDYFRMRSKASGDLMIADYYATALPAPETPIRDVPLIALDIETTGLDSRRDGIVSIGMVPFTLQRIRPAAGFYRVVRPRWPLKQSVTFHQITHSEIAQAPDLDEILPQLLAMLAGRIAVVHFRNIERSFLDAAVRARRGESLLFPVIDTMEIEARWHRHTLWARLLKVVGRQSSIRLPDSRKRYGLPPYPSHHAVMDALATAELLQAQIARHYSPETPIGDLWR